MVVRVCILFVIFLSLFGSVQAYPGVTMDTSGETATCRTPLALPDVRLKDHSLFYFEGWYYIVSIRIDLPAKDERGELTFAYARTRDFCNWEELATPLRRGQAGEADDAYIWAPYVIQVGDTFYMYYTGVRPNIEQSILLATTTNPADPQSWIKQGVVFRPHHPDAVYSDLSCCAACRDPMVLAHGGRYYLYYTGANRDGPMIGIAIADAPAGPWHDLGAVYQSTNGSVPESPFVLEQDNFYYLFYNESSESISGPQWRWSTSPFGPWQPARRIGAGWAHDFYYHDGTWLVSYLIGYGEAIQVELLDWQDTSVPAAPLIGSQTYLPLIRIH